MTQTTRKGNEAERKMKHPSYINRPDGVKNSGVIDPRITDYQLQHLSIIQKLYTTFNNVISKPNSEPYDVY